MTRRAALLTSAIVAFVMTASTALGQGLFGGVEVESGFYIAALIVTVVTYVAVSTLLLMRVREAVLSFAWRSIAAGALACVLFAVVAGSGVAISGAAEPLPAMLALLVFLVSVGIPILPGLLTGVIGWFVLDRRERQRRLEREAAAEADEQGA